MSWKDKLVWMLAGIMMFCLVVFCSLLLLIFLGPLW